MDDNLMEIIEDFERTYEGIDWDDFDFEHELQVHKEEEDGYNHVYKRKGRP